MSSTTGVQNLLVNVFRPVYTYDATTTLFTPKLELSNIDNYSGNTVSVFTAAVGDGSNNVYVGSNAGNPYTTIKSCRFTTALGFGAGSNISNVLNSTYIGYNAGVGASNATNVVAVGANTFGAGISNVFLGAFAGSTGNSNIFIGTSAQGTTGSNNIILGPGISIGSSNNQFRVGSNYLYGRMNTRWLGIGTSAPSDTNTKLDVSGNLYVKGQEGINMVPIRTLDVNGNFRASDSNGTLDFSNGLLDIAGSLNVSNTATMSFSNGTFNVSNANTYLLGDLSVSNLSGDAMSVSNGITTSTSGFRSAQDTLQLASTGNYVIGTVKPGIIMVSVVDVNIPATHRASVIWIASTASNVASLTFNNAGHLSLNTSGSNIQVSNSTVPPLKTIKYSITYFPLP